ncbi:monocarboxylate transporter 12 [Octopus bimaculoides]|uniref:Major facilitator superfamily (MFS) profile domain-containing protein n=1 Tax=Octopus bimaculoides TaxID=37653 RepID=A0A0L8HTN2_OCTBM|nr:monocarboxylate transporter 12 [Octopus bimaculoides]XP_014769456.1 monocarboxylate transporter 12 [Octopus bimaculoides]XP_014769457.1 monocarboxylate transporter 12 [Octopus bimaculoides]XP_014769458.1 monocarboxylate transporter 12 [Octopus bimaculoides]XP_014769461.1 monocarboxylate transporter 12 [Octopus bimaculoides]XP_014769462.1 monocarboxylate transporter 12 [Octopus bimaculoides]|eukprot:XP_014769455.1 PREDICTED: monocarboxylate transporter 12-like [Octopus bimaculoides]
MSDSDEPKDGNNEPLRSSFCDSTDSENSIYAQSPDGGWGWMVLFSSFLLNVIADGCAYSFGVFFTELLQTFGQSKSKTSWVGSVFVGVSLICGPLAGALTTKFGCRKMTIFGGIVSTTGIIISAFVNSIEMLCFTFGFLAGFGMSISYVTSIVSVSFYFEKKRALATGLSVCGSGIGTSVFAPLLEYLIDLYGWRGTMLVLGGIVSNVIVCGALLRPLKYNSKKNHDKTAMDNLSKISKRNTLLNSTLDEGFSSRSYDAQLTYDSDMANLTVSNSVVQLPTYIQLKRASLSHEVFHKLRNSTNHGGDVRVVLGEPNVKQTTSFPDSFSTNKIVNGPYYMSDVLPEKNKDVWQQKTSATKQKPSACSQQNIVHRKDIFYRGNLLKLSLEQKSSSCPEISHLVGTVNDQDNTSDFLDWCEILKSQNISKHMKKLLRTMVNRSILTHPVFILFVISNFIFFFWSDIPYIYIVDQSVKKGIPQQKATYLISVFGLVSTVGQVVFGFAGDRVQSQLTFLYAVSTMLSGVSIIFMPLCLTYGSLSAVSALFGFFSSANNSLCTILLVEYLGLDNLTTAYGLMLLYQGIANLLGPPVAGFLCDTYGSYDYSFYASGAFVILSGLILIPTPYLRSWVLTKQKKETQNKTQQQEPSTSKLIKRKVLSQMETVV